MPDSSPASTLQGATVSVTCAAGYTGTAAQITCGASGSWSAYSGCTSGKGQLLFLGKPSELLYSEPSL